MTTKNPILSDSHNTGREPALWYRWRNNQIPLGLGHLTLVQEMKVLFPQFPNDHEERSSFQRLPFSTSEMTHLPSLNRKWLYSEDQAFLPVQLLAIHSPESQ